MHSKALGETHLFSYIAESLDILRPNHEIAGNARLTENAQREGEGFGDNAQRGGGGVLEFAQNKCYSLTSTPPLCSA